MPRQHPRALRQPHWRSRLASWLRGFAESLDPTPVGLDLSDAPDFWADHVRAAARRAHRQGRAFRMRRWTVSEPRTGVTPAPLPATDPVRGDEPAPARDGDAPPGPSDPGRPVRGRGRAEDERPRGVRRDRADAASARSAERGADAQARAGAPGVSGANWPLVRPRRAGHRQLLPAAAAVRPGRGNPPAPPPEAGDTPRRGPDVPMVRPRSTSPAAWDDPELPRPTSPARAPAPAPAEVAPAVSRRPDPEPRTARPRRSDGDWPVAPPPVPGVPATWPAFRPSRLLLEPVAAPPPAPAQDGRAAEPRPAPPQPAPPWTEPAVLPATLWPDLPPRRPPSAPATDPTPVLQRQQRLTAEQAAT